MRQEEATRHSRITVLAKLALEGAQRGLNVDQIMKGLRTYARVTWAVSINSQREYAETAIMIAAKNAGAECNPFKDAKTINENVLDYASKILKIQEVEIANNPNLPYF